MSKRVRARLTQLNMLQQTTHEERLQLDRELEALTGHWCDDPATDKLSDREFLEALARARAKLKKKAQESQTTETAEGQIVLEAAGVA